MDEVVVAAFTLNVHTKYVDWPLCVTVFPLYDRSIEGGPLCKLRTVVGCRWLQALCFGCQHPAPWRIRSKGHPYRIAAVNKKLPEIARRLVQSPCQFFRSLCFCGGRLKRGEDVMPDEICCRCNEKQQRKRRGGKSVQLPDWVMNESKSNILLLLPGSPK